MSVITIKSNLGDYEVHIDLAYEYLESLVKLEHKIFIIDENVWRLYSHSLLKAVSESDAIIFPVSEEVKTLESVQRIYDQLVSKSAKRNMTLVTIGGGILQDITGFVASTLYRGINWVLIPTTLLAQADSCIGSKTSLNYKGYKNLIGSFYPPRKVWVDTSFLASLRTEDFYSGLGEVVKLHIMGGEEKIRWLVDNYSSLSCKDSDTLQEAIVNSLNTKINFISNDEFDLGRRNMLNYGHCFGHAIEASSDFNIPHGQAVVAGMILANIIAVQRELLSEEKKQLLEKTLLIPTLIIKPTLHDLQPETIIEAMSKDKKRTGQGLVLIMPTSQREMVKVNDLQGEEVNSALEAFIEMLYQ